MKRTDELRMLATKFECDAVDGFDLAEHLRAIANLVETEAIIRMAEQAIESGHVASREPMTVSV